MVINRMVSIMSVNTVVAATAISKRSLTSALMELLNRVMSRGVWAAVLVDSDMAQSS